jgi:hypothetical protein
VTTTKAGRAADRVLNEIMRAPHRLAEAKTLRQSARNRGRQHASGSMCVPRLLARRLEYQILPIGARQHVTRHRAFVMAAFEQHAVCAQ